MRWAIIYKKWDVWFRRSGMIFWMAGWYLGILAGCLLSGLMSENLILQKAMDYTWLRESLQWEQVFQGAYRMEYLQFVLKNRMIGAALLFWAIALTENRWVITGIMCAAGVMTGGLAGVFCRMGDTGGVVGALALLLPGYLFYGLAWATLLCGMEGGTFQRYAGGWRFSYVWFFVFYLFGCAAEALLGPLLYRLIFKI